MAALDQVDRMMNIYRPDSELSQVNQRGALQAVEVSAETYRLLQKALDYSEMTDGAFDVTVGPLLQLWKQAEREQQRPSEADLAAATGRVGYQNVVLSRWPRDGLSDPCDCRVSLAQEHISVNLNAIAKGYAVDRALAALRRRGVAAALVEIGGEIACFGDNCPGGGWRVGIQDPFADDTDNPLSQSARWAIRLSDAAVATSGNYRRYVSVADRRMSHIVDPRTGRPAQKLPSVTVIAPLAADADALATAISVMGPQDGLALVESLPDVEALLVAGTKEDLQLLRSSGWSRYEDHQE